MGAGAAYTERTPARSFRLQAVHATKLDKSDYTFNPSKFYSKKNIYIEKPAVSINTMGELMGISAKGWSAKRKKKRGWRL